MGKGSFIILLLQIRKLRLGEGEFPRNWEPNFSDSESSAFFFFYSWKASLRLQSAKGRLVIAISFQLDLVSPPSPAHS